VIDWCAVWFVCTYVYALCLFLVMLPPCVCIIIVAVMVVVGSSLLVLLFPPETLLVVALLVSWCFHGHLLLLGLLLVIDEI